MLTTRARTPSFDQLLVGLQTEATSLPVPMRITSGSAVRSIRENIGPSRQTRGRRVFRPVDSRHGLPSEHQHRRLMMQL